MPTKLVPMVEAPSGKRLETLRRAILDGDYDDGQLLQILDGELDPYAIPVKSNEAFKKMYILLNDRIIWSGDGLPVYDM